MNKGLRNAVLGLGLSLGSCTIPTPFLYQYLILYGQETPGGGCIGEAETMYDTYHLKATATAMPWGKGQLDVLILNPKTQQGILCRDGVKGPLDGVVDDVVIHAPSGSESLEVKNRDVPEHYVMPSAMLLKKYVVEDLFLQKNNLSAIIVDDFIPPKK